MRHLKNSLKKRWYRMRSNNVSLAKVWKDPYWTDSGDFRVVACRTCPRFDAGRSECRIPYGTPVRKCVVASTEAHFHSLGPVSALEVGFGRDTLARTLVEAGGGTWTGVEPGIRQDDIPGIGQGGFGHAASIPFPDETFDLVFGIQSLEHWEEDHPAIEGSPGYGDCLTEILRVLKPGGRIYFDAPIHLHGHEMFIMGDLPRIAALFGDGRWQSVHIEKWRFEHEPLPPYPTPKGETSGWSAAITSYPPDQIAGVRDHGSVALVAITAEKAPA